VRSGLAANPGRQPAILDKTNARSRRTRDWRARGGGGGGLEPTYRIENDRVGQTRPRRPRQPARSAPPTQATPTGTLRERFVPIWNPMFYCSNPPDSFRHNGV